MQGKQVGQIVLGAGCAALGVRLFTMDTSEDGKTASMAYKLIGAGAVCIGIGNIFLALHSDNGGGGGGDDEEIDSGPDGGTDEVDPDVEPSDLHLEDGVPDDIAELLGVGNG